MAARTTPLASPSLSTPDAVAVLRESAALRVLVVDDNVDGAEALCAVLASLGCATAVAFDGAHGLATAAAFDPHLALIDLEMPDMSGCDLARRFKAGQGGSSAWLICLTGRGQSEDRRLCMEAGFDDFFTKPMLPDSLIHVVATANAALGASTVAP